MFSFVDFVVLKKSPAYREARQLRFQKILKDTLISLRFFADFAVKLGLKKKATFAAFQLVRVLDVNSFLDALFIR